MYRLRVFKASRKEVFRLFSRRMSNFSTGGRSVGRISRISSHFLSSSNRTNIKASFTCNAALNSSEMNTEQKEMARTKSVVDYDIEDDRAVPNEGWTKESVELFNKLKNEADASNGLWIKVPGKTPPLTGNRLFTRCLWDQKGKLFEYSMFMNKREERLKGVVQFGPYTEGPKGYVHGGAISTVMDSIIGVCIHGSGYVSVTANLSVNFKKGVPIGTTALLEGRIDRVEGRKVFGYGEMKNPDGSITYATSTALFVQVRPPPDSDGGKKEDGDM
ncbi:acyl-coenzyme A thioesterase THEM4-like [Actinia tenebrosa]|uniref:Acyl-coenzyme A thioesterase THEM4 n=1 Tax=Actinia tenebrosa TaxID=6105 RepID=A0A6P8I7G5_ACTTE|nr:acyl-coenzyme A thioesterase THEM4-like [Actinia tenebrosa]XP_031564519.1 acyl-coenzyme A thioesterase THEM4-like [Actinia tenebrosa]